MLAVAVCMLMHMHVKVTIQMAIDMGMMIAQNVDTRDKEWQAKLNGDALDAEFDTQGVVGRVGILIFRFPCFAKSRTRAPCAGKNGRLRLR